MRQKLFVVSFLLCGGLLVGGLTYPTSSAWGADLKLSGLRSFVDKMGLSGFIEPRGVEGLKSIPVQSGEPKITLEECLMIAYANNLDLAQKVVTLEGKKLTESSKYRAMLPSISLTSSRTDIVQDNSSSASGAESYSTTVTLSQPIFKGGSLWGDFKKAELATKQAEYDVTRQAQQLHSDVKSAWYSVLEKEALLASSKEALERLKIHEKNAEAYFKIGRYWQNEVLQAQVEVAKGEQAVIEAENALLLAESTLNRLMRRPLDHAIAPKDKLAWLPMASLSLQEAYGMALEKRTDLLKSQLDVDVNRWSEVTTNAGRLPTLDFSVAQSLTGDQLLHRESDLKTTATLTATWTAWDWNQDQKSVDAAKATTQQSQYSYDDKIQSVQLEVRQAYLNAVEASKKVKVLEKALNQSEENLKVNEIRYEQQLGSATDVLDAMELRTSTRNSHISSISAYLTALAQLDLAMGKEVIVPTR